MYLLKIVHLCQHQLLGVCRYNLSRFSPDNVCNLGDISRDQNSPDMLKGSVRKQ